MKLTSSSSTLTRTKRVPWNTQNSVMLSSLNLNNAYKSSSWESQRILRIWKHMNRCSQNTHVIYTGHSGEKSLTLRCKLNKKDNCFSRILTLTSNRPLTISKDKTRKVRATASLLEMICHALSCFPTLTRTFFSINSIGGSLELSITPSSSRKFRLKDLAFENVAKRIIKLYFYFISPSLITC